MSAPGPLALGRGVVVRAGGGVPDAWEGAPVVRVDAGTLDDPANVVSVLHDAWLARSPVVVELGIDPAMFRAPAIWDGEAWRLGPWFEPWLDRLHFLVWANTYDARDGPPVWWWGRKAERLGARALDGGADGPGDVELPDGERVWVDGGPRDVLPGHRRRGCRPQRLRRARPAHRCPCAGAADRGAGPRPTRRGRPRGRSGAGDRAGRARARRGC